MLDRLSALNVIEQAARVCRGLAVSSAWQRGQKLTVNGLVLDRDGSVLTQPSFTAAAVSEIDKKLAENLRKLKSIIERNETLILKCLNKDLHKSETESYTSEIAFVLKEIDLILSKLKKWSKPVKANTPMINKPGISYFIYDGTFKVDGFDCLVILVGDGIHGDK